MNFLLIFVSEGLARKKIFVIKKISKSLKISKISPAGKIPGDNIPGGQYSDGQSSVSRQS